MSIEQPLPPYNPYDPEQNQLLLITPSWRNPIISAQKVKDFLNALEPILGAAKEHIRIRGAMDLVEYFTCYYYESNNPISLSEPAFADEFRQDFTIKVENTFKPQISKVSAEPMVKHHP